MSKLTESLKVPAGLHHVGLGSTTYVGFKIVQMFESNGVKFNRHLLSENEDCINRIPPDRPLYLAIRNHCRENTRSWQSNKGFRIPFTIVERESLDTRNSPGIDTPFTKNSLFSSSSVG